VLGHLDGLTVLLPHVRFLLYLYVRKEAYKTPWEFRRSQNSIGGSGPGNTSFVPPPAELMMQCLASFEHFLHNEKHGLPLLALRLLSRSTIWCGLEKWRKSPGRRERMFAYSRYFNMVS